MSSEEEDEEMPEVSATALCEGICQRAEHREKGAERFEGTGVLPGRSLWPPDREVWIKGILMLRILRCSWVPHIHKPQENTEAEQSSHGLQRHVDELVSRAAWTKCAVL